ncbi:Carboxy-terminal processing protease CtpA [bacterium HR36]|nr:Carboxy-terminal processing protease CtpA [bacterium HR36]
MPADEEPNEDAAPLTQEELRAYVHMVLTTADQISQRYYRPITVEQLLATALTALAEAAGERIPESWRNNPQKWFADTEPILGLVEWRKRLGNRPAIRGRDVEISLRGMFQVLDPHTGFLSPSDRRRMYQLEGGTFGTGILLGERLGKGPVVIENIELGSPAHWAGLRPGDRIHTVNGQSVAEMSLAEAEARLQGDLMQSGKPLRLQVESASHQGMRQVEIIPEIYEPETLLGFTRTVAGQWTYWLEPAEKIGYVRIREIQLQTPEKLEAILTDLKKQGLRGLVLDLRDCPGGVLDGAVRVADLLLGEGPICTVQYRDSLALGAIAPGQAETTYSSTGERSFVDFPVAVLIGSETRGGGELIAAAIQDNRRGILVGQRTHGKASVQQSLPLMQPVGQHTEIKISVGLLKRPSGKNMHRFWGEREPEIWGVLPDVGYEVRLSPALEQRLRQWRHERDLRPPQSRLAHPLDNPKADPVLVAALRYFKKSAPPHPIPALP